MSVSTPFIEIRPRCSNAAIAYYFTGGDSGTPASSFRLLLNGPGPYVSTIVPPQWGYIQSGLTNGAYYSSLVTAIASDGSESEPVYFRTVQPNGFPDPPISITSTLNNSTNTVALSWSPPSAPQTAQIGWYVITNNSNIQNRYNTPANINNILISNVSFGASRYYIQSVNDPGYSEKVYVDLVQEYNKIYYPFEDSLEDGYGTYNMTSNGTFSYNTSTKKIGDASLEFNGTDAYTNFPANNPWNGTTWVGWLYFTDLTDYRTVFDLGQDVNTYFLTHLFNGYMYSAVALNQGSPGGYATNLQGPAANLNQWDHYAFTLDNTTMRIYQNGALGAETSVIISLKDIAPNTGFFGKSFTVAYPYFQGYMDDVGMFNGVLNSNQINYIYSTQTATLSSLSSLTTTLLNLA